jgi:hypothetical protein
MRSSSKSYIKGSAARCARRSFLGSLLGSLGKHRHVPEREAKGKLSAKKKWTRVKVAIVETP